MKFSVMYKEHIGFKANPVHDTVIVPVSENHEVPFSASSGNSISTSIWSVYDFYAFVFKHRKYIIFFNLG